jgi:cob(I)alamin adenosyltransferase
MKIYTRGGDRGETSLISGGRVSKDDALIESYGTVDELNATIGVARTHSPQADLDAELDHIQHDLFDIGAQLASPDLVERFQGVDESRISDLERRIDEMEAALEPLRNFILPGGSPLAAQLHVARTVCRRAERLVVSLHDESERGTRTLRYLNRLSDYLFVAARYANRAAGRPDVIWSAKKQP